MQNLRAFSLLLFIAPFIVEATVVPLQPSARAQCLKSGRGPTVLDSVGEVRDFPLVARVPRLRTEADLHRAAGKNKDEKQPLKSEIRDLHIFMPVEAGAQPRFSTNERGVWLSLTSWDSIQLPVPRFFVMVSDVISPRVIDFTKKAQTRVNSRELKEYPGYLEMSISAELRALHAVMFQLATKKDLISAKTSNAQDGQVKTDVEVSSSNVVELFPNPRKSVAPTKEQSVVLNVDSIRNFPLKEFIMADPLQKIDILLNWIPEVHTKHADLLKDLRSTARENHHARIEGKRALTERERLGRLSEVLDRHLKDTEDKIRLFLSLPRP